MNNLKKIFKLLGVVLIVLYPFVVYKFLGSGMSLRYMAVMILFMVLCHYRRWHNYFFLSLGLLLIVLLLITNRPFFLKLYPVLMNSGVALLFLLSLKDRPLIASFAEKMGYKITPDVLAYTQKATLGWGIFMSFNTLFSVITLFTSDFIWAIYNGFIAYILIGFFFLIELYCRRRMAHHA